MRGGNSLLSSDVAVRDALIIVRGMLSIPETTSRGVIDGIKYIRIHIRQHGTEPHFQTLVELICTDSNSLVKASISDGSISERLIWMAQHTRSLLESAVQYSVLDSQRLMELRCQCSFNLAEIFRQKSRFRSSVTLLKECELILASADVGDSEPPECPSLNLIRTCMAEMMLVIGDPSIAFDKSQEVVDSYFSTSQLSDPERLQAAYALLILVKASVRLGRLRDTAEHIAPMLSELHRDLSPDTDRYFLTLLDRIDNDISRPFSRIRSPQPPTHNEKSRSRGRSEPPATSRHRPAAVESHTVYIPPETHNVSSYCQTNESVAQEEGISSSQDSPLRSQSVPPTSKKYMQSPSATSGHDDDNKQIPSELSTSTGADELQWVECTSRNSGKQYWYNTTTGESTWAR